MATVPAPLIFPDHVPPHLRWDDSLGEFAQSGDDPFLAVSRLHDGPDIFFARDATQQRPAWVITRHALQQEAFVDFEHFSSEGGAGLNQMLGVDWRLAPLDFDPPEHTAFRRIVNPFFTPKAVSTMAAPVRETCERLIAAFADKGGCEFIEDFATPFPSYVFLSLVGMPIEEAPQFLAWEAGLLRGETLADRAAAGLGVMHYLQRFIREQRRQPTTAFLAGLVAAELDGRPIADDDILGLLYTFYLGGLDTVYSTLGWIMQHLALDQDLQRRLRANRELIPQAVDEFCRAYSVVSTSRTVAADFTFHGVDMRKGDLVLMPLFLAGRDPRAWDDPHRIDIGRRPNALTFASGPHFCVGRHLALRELRVALESLLTRFGDIRIAPGEPYGYHTSPVYGIDRLSLILHAGA
jgi:cytochrome P450